MLLIYVLVMALAHAHRIHFLRAGKNHAPGHFHYKVTVPEAWDATSSIEYFECESSACDTFESIKKINISNLDTAPELQIQKSGTVYDIECDSGCLQNKVYKYVKVEFRTSTDVSSEIVEACVPGKFVLLNGSCTDTCLFENIKGVCNRGKILCLHGHEKSTLSSSCRKHDRNALVCSEGLNTGDACRCFSSCGIEVEMVATNELCLDGKRSEDFSVIFKQKMAPIQNALANTYDFFYPKAPGNIWYDTNATTVQTSISFLTNYTSVEGAFDAILGFAQGAAMVMAYIADGVTFQKAVLLEGYVPDTLRQRILSGAPFGDIDALLYFAKQSPLYSTGLAGNFTSPTVIEVNTAYGLPQNASVATQIKNFLEAPLCDINEHVVNNACVTCPTGTTRDARDDASGGNTNCYKKILCLHDNDSPGGCKEITCPAGFYEVSYNVTAPAPNATTPAPVVGNSTCAKYSGSTCELAICDDEGYYISDDNVTCVLCPPGSKCPCSIMDDMELCPSGKYQDEAGQTECKTCAGTVNANRTSCTILSSSRRRLTSDISVETYVKCMPCESGTFQSRLGQTSCDACSPGTSQASTGQQSCDDCVAGKYQSQIAQTSCKQCQKGYCPTGATQQLSCPAGNIIDTGRTSCTQCIEGKFQSSPNQGACTFCEVRKSRILDGAGQPLLLGYYQDEKGQARCKRCDGSVSANSAGLSFAKCAATCTFAAKPHICQFRKELKAAEDLLTACAKEKCTDVECCQDNRDRQNIVATRATSMTTTLLAVFQTVGDADGRDATAKTTVQNDIRFETRQGETDADALGRILGDITDDIGAKSIEKIDEEVYEMTQEELQQERATERRKSPTEQRAKKEQQLVDVSSLKCKELMKNAEVIQNSTEREKALVEVTKAMSIVKETFAEQLKQLRTATSSLANEYGVIVNTKDLPPRNPKLREKMEKGRLPFLKIKIPKDHTSVTDWADFDCSNADVDFDNIGIDDLEEVIINTNETAAACKNGKLVTYVETRQKNITGYDIFNVYCCQNTTRRRLGAGRKRILSSTGRECVSQTHAARTIDSQYIADDEWISGDEYECADSGTYKHPVMSLGATFDGCFVQELLNETGWVYDSPARTLGDCGSSQCTINNTNVTCLYLGNSCQPSCEAGYKTDGTQLTCTGGDIYSTPEPTCTGCTQGKYSSAGDTSCTPCPSGKYVAATGQLGCHDVTQSNTNFVTLLNDNTGVECEYGGTPVYLASGAYNSGCNSPGIVMFGRAEIKVNDVCANKCVKWYSTAGGSNLVDGFIDPSNTGSFVIEVTNMATYCTYLWGTIFNVPKSDKC